MREAYNLSVKSASSCGKVVLTPVQGCVGHVRATIHLRYSAPPQPTRCALVSPKCTRSGTSLAATRARATLLPKNKLQQSKTRRKSKSKTKNIAETKTATLTKSGAASKTIMFSDNVGGPGVEGAVPSTTDEVWYALGSESRDTSSQIILLVYI